MIVQGQVLAFWVILIRHGAFLTEPGGFKFRFIGQQE